MAQGSAARKLPLQEPIQEDEIQYQPVNDPLYYRIIKRFLDLLLSVVALIILSPIFLVTEIAIVVDDSKGGPIFTQTRIGYLGKPFKFYKFRSMCVDAEEKLEDLRTKNEMTGPVFKIRDDKRVTRVGKFIRKYSIDELPQLVNIIKGEMSIVGPRPPLPNEVERYSSFERRRLSVVPGLICYWQVSGRNSVSFDRWMKLDMMYVEHHSLSVDIGLFLKGILTVVQGGGVKYERISFTSIDDNGLVYETERFLYLVCKRVMDIICSMVALGALSPVMGITSAAIKIEDRKGKVIYKQQRVGKHGKLFVFYKFRSMYEDADKLQEELQRMSDPNSPFY
ncbi:MAG: sugar transferase, partial [Oscillospiraceae bacterium]|nr:sugar transferase [Oscillospiraceae bacterium]